MQKESCGKGADKSRLLPRQKDSESPSSLFRLENCQQSATLDILQQIMDRLKCSWLMIFAWS